MPTYRNRIIIGRKDGQLDRIDIALQGPEVSSLHCIIERSDSGILTVQDCSKNGTFINGVHLHQGGQATLQPGDCLRIGQNKLQLMGANGPDFGPPPYTTAQLQAALRFYKTMRKTAAGLNVSFHQVHSGLADNDANKP